MGHDPSYTLSIRRLEFQKVLCLISCLGHWHDVYHIINIYFLSYWFSSTSKPNIFRSNWTLVLSQWKSQTKKKPPPLERWPRESPETVPLPNRQRSGRSKTSNAAPPHPPGLSSHLGGQRMASVGPSDWQKYCSYRVEYHSLNGPRLVQLMLFMQSLAFRNSTKTSKLKMIGLRDHHHVSSISHTSSTR